MPETPRLESTEPSLMQQHYKPFCDDLIAGRLAEAFARFNRWSATEAVQLVLAAACRGDTPVMPCDIDELAHALGVMEDYWPEDENRPLPLKDRTTTTNDIASAVLREFIDLSRTNPSMQLCEIPQVMMTKLLAASLEGK